MEVKRVVHYKKGDYVKVKELDELKAEFGDPIMVECHWASPFMDVFAGGVWEIQEVQVTMNGNPIYSLHDDRKGTWLFSEDTLDTLWTNKISVPECVEMSYEELMFGKVGVKADENI